MVKMINRLTGADMYVAEARVQEYLAQGHSMPEEAPKAEKPKKSAPKSSKKK